MLKTMCLTTTNITTATRTVAVDAKTVSNDSTQLLLQLQKIIFFIFSTFMFSVCTQQLLISLNVANVQVIYSFYFMFFLIFPSKHNPCINIHLLQQNLCFSFISFAAKNRCKFLLKISLVLQICKVFLVSSSVFIRYDMCFILYMYTDMYV